MRGLNLAILGATGAVGTEMLKILAERSFTVKDLKLFAAPDEAGKKIVYMGKEYTVEVATPEGFEGIDLTLVAVGNDISLRYSPEAVKRGSVVVDNSSAYRMDPKVPLVIPEVNGEDIWTHQGIVANPNCATIIAMVPIKPLHDYGRATRIIASTYQSASGAGVPGMLELKEQTMQVLNGQPVQHKAFGHQLAFNVIPHIDRFMENDYTYEEMKLFNEGRKILHCPDLMVTCTSVRVPVFRSHSESITIEFEREVTPEKAKELLAAAPGVKIVDDPGNNVYPMPIDSSDQDLIYVGRIRKDISAPNSLTFWCCGDQIRKGAATNAVQIALLLAEKIGEKA